MSIWTGINSSGKSTLLGQLLIEAVNQNFGVCAYSGELPAPVFRSWIELQMAGPKHLEKSYDEMKQDYTFHVPVDIQKKLRKWYKNKFYIHDTFGTAEAGDLMDVFEYAAETLGCKVFMIDNLMTTSLRGRDYYRSQSQFIGRVVDFAHKFKVHVHIVAHPRKTRSMVTKMDISGSGDITNRADNVFCVTRFKPGDDRGEFDGADTALHVLKNRFSGRKQDIGVGLRFDERSRRFCMVGEGFGWEYGWSERI